MNFIIIKYQFQENEIQVSNIFILNQKILIYNKLVEIIKILLSSIQ